MACDGVQQPAGPGRWHRHCSNVAHIEALELGLVAEAEAVEALERELAAEMAEAESLTDELAELQAAFGEAEVSIQQYFYSRYYS